jgi:hypothetical protein
MRVPVLKHRQVCLRRGALPHDNSCAWAARRARTGIVDEFAEDLRRDLFWCEVLVCVVAMDLDIATLILDHPVRHLCGLRLHLIEFGSDETLHREKSVLRVDDRLPFGNLHRQDGACGDVGVPPCLQPAAAQGASLETKAGSLKYHHQQ